MDYQKYCALAEKHREEILAAERYIWQHPESGYKEWNTHRYMAEIFEKAGYALVTAGDIPGFYTDIDTGRPGPKLLIMAELDALVAPTHPEAWNNCAHACGHHAQCAAMVGIALALKEPGALDGLSGSIRLMLVPAEELIEVDFRNDLRKKGVIHYFGGKVEFLYRGYMDGVDLGYMFHTGGRKDGVYFDINRGQNGCMAKDIVYEGVAAHAGGSPDKAINALYAASLGLQAINSLRETFRDDEHVRVHPILTEGGTSVNIIPCTAHMSSYVRGMTMDSIIASNRKVNRALAAGALALGAKVHVSDVPGYAPLINDPTLYGVMRDCMTELYGADRVDASDNWSTGSTDMGDLSTVLPVCHPHFSGAGGHGHGDDYRIDDPETACVRSAGAQLTLAAKLLSDGAAEAKRVVANYKPLYGGKEGYFKLMDQRFRDWELVDYTAEGEAEIHY